MRTLIILAAPFVLLACSQDAEELVVENEAAADNAAYDAQAEPGEQTLAEANEDGSAPAADSLTAAMPARFRGVWDIADGACDPRSINRFEVNKNLIVFYESTGAITGVSERADGGIDVELAMSGEGENWEQTVGLRVGPNGGTLDTITPGDNTTIQRKKCAANS